MKLSSNLGSAIVEIIIVVMVAGIMVGVPLFITAKGTDDAAKLAVQTAVTNFVNRVKTTGVITQEDYDNLILDLQATGNAYDTEITIQKLDENLAKKSSDAKGSGTYYTIFDTQVTESLPYKGSAGDIVTVKAFRKGNNWVESVTGFLSGNTNKDEEIAEATAYITGNPVQ